MCLERVVVCVSVIKLTGKSEAKRFGDEIKFKPSMEDVFLEDHSWMDSDEETFDSGVEFSMKYKAEAQSADTTNNGQAQPAKKHKVA